MAFFDIEPEEGEKEALAVVEQKMAAINNAAALRDKLFDEGPEKAVKVLGGVAIGLYIIYRLLLK